MCVNREFLSKPRRTSQNGPTEVRLIRDNSHCWPVRLLCRVLDVHPSGLNVWLQEPHSQRHQPGLMLTG